eukprot:EG_transcript_23515
MQIVRWDTTHGGGSAAGKERRHRQLQHEPGGIRNDDRVSGSCNYIYAAVEVLCVCVWSGETAPPSRQPPNARCASMKESSIGESVSFQRPWSAPRVRLWSGGGQPCSRLGLDCC